MAWTRIILLIAFAATVPALVAEDSASTGGWAVIEVDQYRELLSKAHPAEQPTAPPPVDAAFTSIEYDLRLTGDSAVGTARLAIDVLKDGWVRMDIPKDLRVQEARTERS